MIGGYAPSSEPLTFQPRVFKSCAVALMPAPAIPIKYAFLCGVNRKPSFSRMLIAILYRIILFFAFTAVFVYT